MKIKNIDQMPIGLAIVWGDGTDSPGLTHLVVLCTKITNKVVKDASSHIALTI